MSLGDLFRKSYGLGSIEWPSRLAQHRVFPVNRTAPVELRVTRCLCCTILSLQGNQGGD